MPLKNEGVLQAAIPKDQKYKRVFSIFRKQLFKLMQKVQPVEKFWVDLPPPLLSTKFNPFKTEEENR